jgi:hypothetical protein
MYICLISLKINKIPKKNIGMFGLGFGYRFGIPTPNTEKKVGIYV